jgi:hypothetical protein
VKTGRFERLTAVSVDHGSGAPAIVVREVFRRRGVDLAVTQRDTVRHLSAAAERILLAAGVHLVIESVADLGPALERIDSRFRAGESPVSVSN